MAFAVSAGSRRTRRHGAWGAAAIVTILLAGCGAPVSRSAARSEIEVGESGRRVSEQEGANLAEIEETGKAKWHADRIARLTAPEGWLSLVGLDFLADGSVRVGRGQECELSYQGCSSPVIGRFEVEADAVRFLPEPDAEVRIEHGEFGAPLVADDVGRPSVVRSGSVSLTLVRRNGRLALRVRDSESPTRVDFQGVELFPDDRARCVQARVIPARAGELLPITNVMGFEESQPIAATLEFELDGAAHTLVAMPAGEGRLFVVFGDETNGVETYGGGRFLDVEAAIAGRTTLDFNRAYNPPCAFTAFATCPLPPAANRLPLRVEAGERAPRSTPHSE